MFADFLTLFKISFEGEILSYEISTTDKDGNIEHIDDRIEHNGKRDHDNKEFSMINDISRISDKSSLEKAINEHYTESDLNEFLFFTV